MAAGARRGSDPDSLRSSRSTLAAVAERLGGLAAECDAAVASVRWAGDDADELRLAWRSVRASFDEAVGGLLGAARRLEAEAAEQDLASTGA